MPEPAEPNKITIAAANNGMNGWELQCLISTFEKASWQIRDHRLALMIFGGDFGFDCKSAMDIRFVGLPSKAKVEQMLSTADIVYCAQTLDPKYAEFVRSHLPSELAPFLASGRPLVFHGPEFAAAAELLSAHNAAVFCHSYEQLNVELYNCFDRLIFDSEYYKNIAAQGLLVSKHKLIQAISHERLGSHVKSND